jgi:Phage integrase, N-terminal SAM-like domain
MGKGPQGRGSIIFDHEGAPCADSKYHRHCRGRWRGVFSKGFGADGRRKRYKVSGRTKQDVIEALKTKSEELDAGLSTSRSYKAEAAAYDWLEHGLPGRSERTREVYRDALAPLLEKIGKRPQRDLTAGDVEAGLRSLAANLSSRSLQIAHNSLRRTIRYAEANGKVGRNVAGAHRHSEGAGRPSQAGVHARLGGGADRSRTVAASLGAARRAEGSAASGCRSKHRPARPWPPRSPQRPAEGPARPN